jgi:hypothetical protein
MNTKDTAYAALSAVLEEADARTCRSCGTRASVRIPSTVGGDASTAGVSGVPGGEVAWFCFECGHEDPGAD